MTADQPGAIVIASDLVECEDECVSGSFTWTPGPAIQELFQEIETDSPEDYAALKEIMAARAHDFLVAVAAAPVTYMFDEDGSAFEKAQSFLEDAGIELNAQFGIMEMEATLANPHEEEPDSSP